MEGGDIMAMHIGHISDESIDDYLKEIDLEKVLLNFGLIEPDYEIVNFDKQQRTIDAKAAVLPTGSEFIEVTNQKYNQNFQINHDTADTTNYGDAA